MSQNIIAATVAAGNGSAATIFQMPASMQGTIDNGIVTNTTGGILTITLVLTRLGVTYTILPATNVAANGVSYFGRGSSLAVFPLTLNAGEIITGQGSGAGLNVTLSGIRFST